MKFYIIHIKMYLKKLFLSLIICFFIFKISAQSPTLKINGIFVGGYYLDDNKEDKTSTFNIRHMRFILSGNLVKEFSYLIQMEFAGNTRLLDAYLNWGKYDFFQVKAGQMFRNFGYEIGRAHV